MLFIGAGVLLASAATAGEPQLYLTWHAPYGYPRASETVMAACDDTSHADTLYLSFDPGQSYPTFLGVKASLVFHPPAGDSLGPWWLTECDRGLPSKFKVKMDLGLEYPQPWRVEGAGASQFDCAGGAARLSMIFAVPYDKAGGIRAGSVYCFARIIVRHPPPTEPGCDQPICIEWSESQVSFDIGPHTSYVTSGPHRFASWNSPGGKACVTYRRAAALRSWKPRPGP